MLRVNRSLIGNPTHYKLDILLGTDAVQKETNTLLELCGSYLVQNEEEHRLKLLLI